jgi:hypothetical protein
MRTGWVLQVTKTDSVCGRYLGKFVDEEISDYRRFVQEASVFSSRSDARRARISTPISADGHEIVETPRKVELDNIGKAVRIVKGR